MLKYAPSSRAHTLTTQEEIWRKISCEVILRAARRRLERMILQRAALGASYTSTQMLLLEYPLPAPPASRFHSPGLLKKLFYTFFSPCVQLLGAKGSAVNNFPTTTITL